MTARSPREPEIDRLGREAFINLFLASSRFTDQVESICKAEGITMSHYVVLWVICLSDERDGVPMRRIADGLLTRASDATRLVDRLTSAGHTERRNSEADRRVVLVRPTRTGRTLFQRITKAVKELHREQWSALSLAELRELRRLLVKALWGGADVRDRHPLETRPPAAH
jgi:MarR family transcriptional regulator, 2-MHQ and catechol-resistance regulon repressor